MGAAETHPLLDSEPTPDRAGLRLADLVGLVIGYGLASLLTRSVWPGASNLSGGPLVALGLEFIWLGLAMSGPVLLVLGRIGSASGRAERRPTRRPARLGRPIGEVPVAERWAVREAVPSPRGGPAPREWTRAELAWLAIGSYWICLTLFLTGARALPGTITPFVPGMAFIGLVAMVPVVFRSRGRGQRAAPRWTQLVAVLLLWTWPIAWGLLVLLGQTL